MRFHANQGDDSHGPENAKNEPNKKQESHGKEDQELEDAVINSKGPAPPTQPRLDQELVSHYNQQETKKLRVELSLLNTQMNKMKITVSEKNE